MNRLQKKCVMATVGVHLLLLVILIVGPAFFTPKSKTEDFHVLDVIPANLIDASVNSGAQNAQPPAPVVTPPQPQPADARGAVRCVITPMPPAITRRTGAPVSG